MRIPRITKSRELAERSLGKGRDFSGFENGFNLSQDEGQEFFVSGGTLPPDSASYVERSADKYLFDSLKSGNFCYVLNPRQLGKSSLSVHSIGRLRAAGIRTAFLDMTGFGGQNVTAEQWYTGIALELSRVLGVRKQGLAYWRENSAVAPVHRLFGLIRYVLLSDSDEWVDGQGVDASPLVIFIDEIDATRNLPFDPDEFYAAIRECFNRRVSDPAMRKLTFCLLGVAVPSDLIRTRAITPFNIGERILLEDFTLEELTTFAEALGPNGPTIIKRVHYWTGGHPFLSQSLCRSISNMAASGTALLHAREVDDIVARDLLDIRSRDANINLADVANIVLHYDNGEGDPQNFLASTLSAYRQILSGKRVIDDESNRSLVVLKLSGIVRSNGRHLRIRNRIYSRVFNRAWVEEHMPEQERRRQRQSFMRGAGRSALVGGCVLVLVAGVAAFAWKSRVEAIAAKTQLAYELYVADINSLPLFYDRGDTVRVEAILNRHKNSPYRGFEWGYWFGRLHDSKEEFTLDYKAPGKVETGHISTDGKEVCVVDDLTSTATILNRETKQKLATFPVDLQYVVPGQNRWIMARPPAPGSYSSTPLQFIDAKTQEYLSTIGDPTKRLEFGLLRDHSDFVLTYQVPISNEVGDATGGAVSLWNVITGKKLRTIADVWERNGLLSFSANGRYLLTSGPSPVLKGGLETGMATVRDLTTGKVVDQFDIGQSSQLLNDDLNGSKILFQADGGYCTRNIFSHKTAVWKAPPAITDWRLGESNIQKAMFIKDSVLNLVGRGRCLINDASQDGLVAKQENVTRISAGRMAGEYVASSTSVRIYQVDSPSTERIIAHGNRVTKFGPGQLNVFQSGPNSIQRIDETSFHMLGSTPKAVRGGTIMYSGHWTLVQGPTHMYDHLQSADGSYPLIKLPFAPLMWSSAIDPDSIALWHPKVKQLVAFSGKTGKVRWSRPVTQVNAVWVSPNGKRIFVSSAPFRDIVVFDMKNGAHVGTMKAHNSGPIFLTFTQDDNRIFTCGGDGRAVLWDTRTLHRLMEFKGNQQDSVTSADLSPDGRRVVTTSNAGSWQLWDAATGVQLLHVQASFDPLTAAVFSSDGNRIFTAGADSKVFEWTKVEADPTTYIPVDDKFLANLYR